MGIADIRRAFESGLQGKATCLQAALSYGDGGKTQKLFFTVAHAGAQQVLTEDLLGGANPVNHAKKMAADYIKTLGG